VSECGFYVALVFSVVFVKLWDCFLAAMQLGGGWWGSGCWVARGFVGRRVQVQAVDSLGLVRCEGARQEL
jgi:hypothetical protein